MRKASCRRALRGSPSGKGGSCFREGCARGTAWVSKQASAFISAPSFPLLRSQLSPGSALQIPVCKQPGGMGSSAGQGLCLVMHLAPGNPQFAGPLGIIVRRIVNKSIDMIIF